MGIVYPAFITSGGPEVAEPILRMHGDEVPKLDSSHHSMVVVDALGDGGPALTVLLQCFPAILKGDLGDQPLGHAEQRSLDRVSTST